MKILHGFTLIEVLVALAIVAVAFAAVHRAVGQSIDSSALLSNKTLALWVAQDRLAHHKITDEWPSTRTHEGTSEMSGREWRWKEKVSTTALKDLRRVEIDVSSEDGRELAHLVGYLRSPESKQPEKPAASGSNGPAGES